LRYVVCRPYGVEPDDLSRRGSRHEARAALAYLARQHTEASHAELAGLLEVSLADSVPNRTRRFARWLEDRGASEPISSGPGRAFPDHCERCLSRESSDCLALAAAGAAALGATAAGGAVTTMGAISGVTAWAAC
jgi:hypothetical protein